MMKARQYVECNVFKIIDKNIVCVRIPIIPVVFFLFPAYSDPTEPIPFRQRMQHQFAGEPQTGERG